jgi:hypothetical protein
MGLQRTAFDIATEMGRLQRSTIIWKQPAQPVDRRVEIAVFDRGHIVDRTQTPVKNTEVWQCRINTSLDVREAAALLWSVGQDWFRQRMLWPNRVALEMRNADGRLVRREPIETKNALRRVPDSTDSLAIVDGPSLCWFAADEAAHRPAAFKVQSVMPPWARLTTRFTTSLAPALQLLGHGTLTSNGEPIAQDAQIAIGKDVQRDGVALRREIARALSFVRPLTSLAIPELSRETP